MDPDGPQVTIRHCVCIGLLVAALTAVSAAAQEPERGEYEVKAAYLVRFGRLLAWKDGPRRSRPFEICIIGADRFGRALDSAVKGAFVDGRPVLAKRVTMLREARLCDVLFVSDSEQPNVADILTGLDHAGVLTVSDMPQFVNRGGMIQFVIRDGRVRFEINLTPAQQAGITMSADLLSVASVVRNGRQVERR
jgi:hypothetical protein